MKYNDSIITRRKLTFVKQVIKLRVQENSPIREIKILKKYNKIECALTSNCNTLSSEILIQWNKKKNIIGTKIRANLCSSLLC